MNLQINTNVAVEVLSKKELSTLKELITKVQQAELDIALTKEEECDCIKCSLEEAISSTTEEVTPELLEHFLNSILKEQGINGKLVKMKVPHGFDPNELKGFPFFNESKEKEDIPTPEFLKSILQSNNPFTAFTDDILMKVIQEITKNSQNR